MTTAKPIASKALTRNAKKWTPAVMAAGWTAFPSIILEKQQALGLDPLDINILLQLARHWWEHDNPPYPSKGTIAKAINVEPRTVQRRIAELERGGLIRRVERKSAHGGNKSNRYMFDGLIKAVTPFAIEAVEERTRHAKERQTRRASKRPARLRVVKR